MAKENPLVNFLGVVNQILSDPAKAGKAVRMRTYIYYKDKGCAHLNAASAFIGQEYYHDDPNWQLPSDWPYEIIDNRKEKGK